MLKIVPLKTRSKHWGVLVEMVWDDSHAVRNRDVLSMTAERKARVAWLEENYEPNKDFLFKITSRWCKKTGYLGFGYLIYFRTHVEATAFKLRWG